MTFWRSFRSFFWIKSPRHTNMSATAVLPQQNGFSPAKKVGNMVQVTLKFKKLTENAVTPTRGSEKAAGYDLYSAYACVVPAQGKHLIKTDLQIALPDGCYGRVAPRSGLAVKKFIDVGAGVIDQDYRGNVGVVLFNFAKEDFVVEKGERIAQLILEQIFLPQLEECTDLEETERGSGGFGSSGTK